MSTGSFRNGIRSALLLAAGMLLVAAAAPAGPPEVRARYLRDPVPVLPDDPRWEKVSETTLPLSGQIIVPPVGGGSVATVAIRAAHDAKWLAVRLEWADPSADREVGVDTFRDAVAVGFPVLESGAQEDGVGVRPPPSPFMGDAENPVSIWQWTADLEATALGQGGFAERYPHTDGVWYFPQDDAVYRQVRAWRGHEPVVEFVATGFGTLRRRPTRNVEAVSRHANGRWSVVMRRQLATGDPQDTPFRPGEATQLIAAVWNGSGAEVNGRKSVTLSWTPLVLEATVASDAGP